ncbi:hypothetical protein B0H19DRAFT_1094861 [Mycena capillaripes]|nr:hypothetical protein B0H19DRAFT_1094861 [Mycena capillaripes]
MSALVPPGVVCTAEEYARSVSDPSIYCLTRGQSIGLTVTAESGLISLVAVLGVFSLIIRNALRHVHHTKKWVPVHTSTDVLILALFFADLIQALGAVLDVHWISLGKVHTGAFCTAQGVVQQLGETAVALTTLLMTLFTFAGVWWRAGLGSTRLATFLVVLVWVFVALLVGVGNAVHKGELYEAPTPYWCWIGGHYLGLRIGGEYVWFWVTLAVSLCAYLTLFLWARGNITVNEERWWACSFHRSPKPSKTRNSKANANGHTTDAYGNARPTPRRAAYAMIAYPACYCVLILPLSVVRWLAFTRGSTSIPSAATFGVISLYGLSGVINVALLLYTRPNSVLFRGDACDDGGGGENGRAPSLDGDVDEESVQSEFRVRVRGEGSQRSRDTARTRSSLQLGRLPSASDGGGWDLPRKAQGVVHRQDDESVVDVVV